MINILESELYKEYPKVAPQADIMGFTYEDIKILLSKIEQDLPASSYFNTSDSRQVALKAIIARLNLERDKFFEHLEMTRINEVPDVILETDCGRYNLKAYKAIIK